MAVDFSTFSAADMRQHIQVLGIKNREQWQDTCGKSLGEACRRGRTFYRGVAEGLLATPFMGKAPLKKRIQGTLDFCVERGILTCDELLLADRAKWLQLGGQNTPDFWQAARILSGIEKLPDDFDPVESPLPLSLAHCALLGVPPPPGGY